MKIIMRGGFRPTRDDDDTADARRRLQAALALQAASGQDGGQAAAQQQRVGIPNSLGVGNATSAALASAVAAHSASAPPQQAQLPFSSLFASMQPQLAMQRDTQHSQAASFLHDQRLAIQRAQIEAQLQAQAQAQIRIRSLLEQEAQTEEQILFLQARQRLQQQDDFRLQAALSMARTPAPSSGFHGTSSLHLSLAGHSVGDLGPLLSSANLSFARSPVFPVQEASPSPGQPNLPNTAGGAGDPLPEMFRLESLQAQALFNSSVTASTLTAERKEMESDEETDRGERKAPEERMDLDPEERKDRMSDDDYFRTYKNPREVQPVKGAGGELRRTREPFPIKLYRMLHEAEKNGQSDVISFFPHGKAFAVHKSKEFIHDIMPKYFGAGRMNTFLKQLNLYNFRRITEGPDKGGYFHPQFEFGKRHQCKQIKRKKASAKAAPGEAEEATRDSPTDQLYEGDSEPSSPPSTKKRGKAGDHDRVLENLASSSEEGDDTQEKPSPRRRLLKKKWASQEKNKNA